MLIPVVIRPAQLVPHDGELDADREVPCLCANVVKMKNVSLVWTYPAEDESQTGYYAVCSQMCYLKNLSKGSA